MKKIIFISLLFISYAVNVLQAQRVTNDTIITVANVTNDTTIFIPFRYIDGRYFEIDINTLNANTDTIECGYALDKTFMCNATGFPVVANKNTYKDVHDGTGKARIGVITSNWTAKYIAIRYVKVGSTSGSIVLIY
jgi:hypothetical protein